MHWPGRISLFISSGEPCMSKQIAKPFLSRLYVATALIALLSFAQSVEAQAHAGTPNWSAYDRGQYDTISLQTLSVSLNIPVMSKSGAFPFYFNLTGGD